MLVVQPPNDQRKLRRRSRLGCVQVEAPDGDEFVIVKSLNGFGGFFVIDRRPQLRGLRWIRKPGRHHADDGIGLHVEMDGLI